MEPLRTKWEIIDYRLEIFSGNTSNKLAEFNVHIDGLIERGYQPWGPPVARPGHGHSDDERAYMPEICQAFVRYRGFGDPKDQS